MNDTLKEVVKNLSKTSKKSYKITNKLENGSIIYVLNNEVLYSKAQLMVIGTHGRSGISRMLSVNVAETENVHPSVSI